MESSPKRRLRSNRRLMTLLGVASVQAMALAHAPVWINEMHYNNAGTDTGEFVEVAGVAGTDLTGWSLVLYNGTNGQAYNTVPLAGALSDVTGTGFGFAVVNYAPNGIQNGVPDGMAIVDPFDCAIEFISYGGTFVAADGPATGMESVDIGVTESGVTPIGFSLQLMGQGLERDDFSWGDAAESTSGASNAGQSFVESDCVGDANRDGTVNFSDVTAVLGNWLNNCP